MVVVFWSFTGFVFVTAVPARMSYDTDYVTGTLIPALEGNPQTRPKIGLCGVKLHWDGARPHRSTSPESLLSAKGIHLLPHPPYSPVISPSDLYLFGKFKQVIHGTQFHDSGEIVEKFRVFPKGSQNQSS